MSREPACQDRRTICTAGMPPAHPCVPDVSCLIRELQRPDRVSATNELTLLGLSRTSCLAFATYLNLDRESPAGEIMDPVGVRGKGEALPSRDVVFPASRGQP